MTMRRKGSQALRSALARYGGCTCVVAIAVLTFAPRASAIELIDPAAIPKNPEELIARVIDAGAPVDRWADESIERERWIRTLGFVPEADAATGEEVRSQEDWCLWWAFSHSAYQVQAGQPVDQTISNNLAPCLAQHLPSQTVPPWIVQAWIVQGEIHLLLQLHPEWSPSEAYQAVVAGIALPVSTWRSFLAYTANSLPPANTQ